MGPHEIIRQSPAADVAAQLATDVAAVTAAKANIKAGETILGSEAGTYYGPVVVFGREQGGTEWIFGAYHELHLDAGDFSPGYAWFQGQIDILRMTLGEWGWINNDNTTGPIGTVYIDEFGDNAALTYSGAAWDCENLVINCTLASTCTFNIAGGNFNVASVNGLMAALVASSCTGATVDVSGGTSAAPSLQGVTDRTAAIAAGCSVTTN